MKDETWKNEKSSGSLPGENCNIAGRCNQRRVSSQLLLIRFYRRNYYNGCCWTHWCITRVKVSFTSSAPIRVGEHLTLQW